MTVTVATWNINSIRLRVAQVGRFLEAQRPDILCLQEIKCANGHFPAAALHELGYRHIAVNGQKAYHGVATLSRRPFAQVESLSFCGKEDARHLAVSFGTDAGADLAGITVHNFYVPAGGDIPDPEVNDKFAHKLEFLSEMRAWSRGLRGNGAALLVGDLNIAPLETDVWSHKQLLRVVSHTPVEVEHLNAVQAAGDWVDVVRAQIPPEERLYTWWSYRAQDWEASDRGRRLDHIWASPGLAERVVTAEVIKQARGWPQPSDHAPVVVRLKRSLR
ncbi:MAG: exodeoxyribonuclease III [Hyphomicrobiales bacterium]|nr:exodeoxyribonuclease III [Hyphomicrobiales bacterium]